MSQPDLIRVERAIRIIRGDKVILDEDLAELYGVEVKRLNEQVRRNLDRFPADFMFQLTNQEFTDLKSQFATASQWGGRRTPPYAFSEQGERCSPAYCTANARSRSTSRSCEPSCGCASCSLQTSNWPSVTKVGAIRSGSGLVLPYFLAGQFLLSPKDTKSTRHDRGYGNSRLFSDTFYEYAFGT